VEEGTVMKNYNIIIVLMIALLLLAACSNGDSNNSPPLPDDSSQTAVADDSNTTEVSPPGLDPAFYTEFEENRMSYILFTDGKFVYLNGLEGIYRIDRDETAAAELIFTPETGIVFDMVVYGDMIFYV